MMGQRFKILHKVRSIKGIEINLISLRKTEIPVDWHGTLQLNSADEPENYICSFRDISKRRLIEQSKQDFNQKKSEFISLISYSLKDPLTDIKANINYIEQNPQLELFERKAYFERLRHKIGDMEDLVYNAFILSKMDLGEFPYNLTKIDLSLLIHSRLEFFKSQYSGKIQLHQSICEPIIILGDVQRISQLVDILIEEALNCTDPKKREITLTLEKGSPFINLQITHNGLTLDSERKYKPNNQFTEFNHDKNFTKISIHIAFKIMNAHGGSLRVKGNYLQPGMTFLCEFPTP